MHIFCRTFKTVGWREVEDSMPPTEFRSLYLHHTDTRNRSLHREIRQFAYRTLGVLADARGVAAVTSQLFPHSIPLCHSRPYTPTDRIGSLEASCPLPWRRRRQQQRGPVFGASDGPSFCPCRGGKTRVECDSFATCAGAGSADSSIGEV